MLLNISNIQHFSVGDGAGIRTTVFFKGCNLHCPWCHNPETLSPLPAALHYQNADRTEICGKLLTVDEVLRDVLEDKDYYDESGGGVTFSGGEVMLQFQGARALAESLHAQNVSVIVDTAGHVDYAAFEALNPYVDEYLYDFKTASSAQYAQAIGGNLENIRCNLLRLLSDGKRVRVRIPLIPGFNTDESSILALCRMLKSMGIDSVDLLPFHRMGSGKYEAMGLSYAYRNTPPLCGKPLREIEKQFSQFLKVCIEH